ncbi:hypothetical protein [Frigoriglobus tundricola]|uniref:Uncharacterized protein n=1 Tax=Frigoriglobus tundricola TaxID=2774151 RepID=A0A6M5YGX7_9BACT|nr:hypothetical protein [Frigoriglobus tundricola]QJW93248.1 hypothetical protein FTUN_0753 [Frigoriglobus tundricola]
MSIVVSKPGKNKRNKWKDTLYSETLNALLPYIDPFKCGEHYIGPDGNRQVTFSISKETARLYKENPSTARYRNRYFAGVLSPRHIKQGTFQNDQYYTSNRTAGTGKGLAYLDIDAHQGEPDKDALTAAVTALVGRENLFISNDNRLYLKVLWLGHSWEQFTKTVKLLHDACRAWAIVKGFQATVDSPKGLTQLGRLPLNHWNYPKLEEFKAAPDVTLSHIEQLTADIWAEVKAARENTTEGNEEGKVIPFPESVAQQVGNSGSVSGVPFAVDDVKPMIAEYRGVAARLKAKVRHVPNRQRITDLDINYCFVIHNLCALHPNEDKQCPVSRCRAWWNYLYECGVFTRAWDNAKWKCLRDNLTDCGCLDAIDCRYWFDVNGKSKGKAMQYELNARYVVRLEESSNGERASILDAAIAYNPFGWRPVLIERKNSWFTPELDRKLDDLLFAA